MDIACILLRTLIYTTLEGLISVVYLSDDIFLVMRNEGLEMGIDNDSIIKVRSLRHVEGLKLRLRSSIRLKFLAKLQYTQKRSLPVNINMMESVASLRSKVIPKPKAYYRYAETTNPDVWFETSEIHYMENGLVEVYSRNAERNTGMLPGAVAAF
ncbi:putative DNA ligase (ATP) [Lupinus albus]|uniref:Putative DNA ligase (ATP) n=1 Tax=Lupinus albus TaxID=3870 RepID=A0A6A4QS43_LUPAL|nr:putative DNA ligase (ATP) [Lupinus albus]